MPDYRLRTLNGRYVVVWYEDGKRRRWHLEATSAAEARSALREFAHTRDDLTQPQRQLTVGSLWNEYVTEREAQGRVSVPRMRDAWKSLVGHFGSLDTTHISGGCVRDYIAARRRVVRDGTIHVELGYLRAALRYAAKRGIISSAPHIDLPSKPRPNNRYLTADEARRLIDATRMPHMRLFILLALYTAGRPSSILGLTWSRVDHTGRRISFDDPGHDRTAKGRACVPLVPALEEPLKEARNAAQTDYVIEWAGKRVVSVKKGIAGAARRAGLEGVTPYVMRHTAAVWMAEGGVPMGEISQYLGHTSTAVTERVYARFSPDYLRRAGGAISTVLLGAGATSDRDHRGNKRGTKGQ